MLYPWNMKIHPYLNRFLLHSRICATTVYYKDLILLSLVFESARELLFRIRPKRDLNTLLTLWEYSQEISGLSFAFTAGLVR